MEEALQEEVVTSQEKLSAKECLSQDTPANTDVANTFSSEDVIPDRNPEADAVIIKAVIANKIVHCIHVNLGSSAEVTY